MESILTLRMKWGFCPFVDGVLSRGVLSCGVLSVWGFVCTPMNIDVIRMDASKIDVIITFILNTIFDVSMIK